MTNVKPIDLNYHHYTSKKYDKDIVNSIPGYREMHAEIGRRLSTFKSNLKILDLGPGTGNTSNIINKNTSNSSFILIDFSDVMLEGAKTKLRNVQCEYILADYSEIELPTKCDVVVSVIGMHHQESDDEKRSMFQKIYYSLNEGGSFIYGDLMTFEDKETAALNDALHYHFLVSNAEDRSTLKDWAYHHKFLNSPASIEKSVHWLEEIGFLVEIVFNEINTFLIFATKD